MGSGYLTIYNQEQQNEMTKTAFRLERASRKMLFLRDLYMRHFPDERLPIDPGKIARWAYEAGEWKPKEVEPTEVLRRKLCRAFRHEYFTDPQGREVRASIPSVAEIMTADGPKRVSRFYPLFEAPEPVARQFIQLERRIFVENAVQLSLDLESYNDNNTCGAVLPPIDWNIGRDIEERAMSTEYDPDPYGDEDEDDA